MYGMHTLQLCNGSPGAAPKERDLELAFTLTDEGQRGRMDIDDFANVFALVQGGQVEGLAGDRKTGNTVAGKKDLESRKASFCDAVKVRARKALYSLPHKNVQTAYPRMVLGAFDRKKFERLN